MMNKTKLREIGALTLVVLSILTFTAYSIHLIISKISLPPWSIQTEGKYVAYGLEVLGFIWSIPVVISLFLLAYLVHPSRFERFSMMAKVLSITLSIGGFGITVLLITSAIINNLPLAHYFPIFIFRSIAGTSMFWIMGILAVFAFKKNKYETMKKEYKLMILTLLGVIVITTMWFMMFAIFTYW